MTDPARLTLPKKPTEERLHLTNIHVGYGVRSACTIPIKSPPCQTWSRAQGLSHERESWWDSIIAAAPGEG